MSKKLLFFISILPLLSFEAVSQGYIDTMTVSTSACGDADFRLKKTVPAVTLPNLSATINYGDGSSATMTNMITDSSFVSNHFYQWPGSYPVKCVVFDNGSPVDSLYYTHTRSSFVCQDVMIRSYIDVNSDCISDTGDYYKNLPVSIRVDSNGIAVDTLSSLAGLYYNTTAPVGTVYTYTMLSYSAGLSMACPSTGVVTRTVSSTGFIPDVYFGFNCVTGGAFDLSIEADVKAGVHASEASFIVSNNHCNGVNTDVTMTFSPKYNFNFAVPLPASVNGNVITWHLNDFDSIAIFKAYLTVSPGPYLPLGDTVHNMFLVTPFTGDGNTANNSIIVIDTVKSSYDPNDKSVTPEGNILPGTELKYMINFENTGNDSAHNIYVLDTLPDYLDANSLKMVVASHTMYLYSFKWQGHTVVKFDFPDIYLPDSTSDHNKGGFVFTINAKPGSPFGTTIQNRVGIYFDDNDVVLTNYATNYIGWPQFANVLANTNNVFVYPNPATENLTIVSSAHTSWEISNGFGQMLMQKEIRNGGTSIDISKLPPGIYAVTLSGSKGTETHKFQKL